MSLKRWYLRAHFLVYFHSPLTGSRGHVMGSARSSGTEIFPLLANARSRCTKVFRIDQSRRSTFLTCRDVHNLGLVPITGFSRVTIHYRAAHFQGRLRCRNIIRRDASYIYQCMYVCIFIFYRLWKIT